jgi:hypothetical protein
MGRKVLPDLWARPRARGASCALARNVGRGRDLTFPRRLVPFACRARPDNPDAPRGAMDEAYAIRDALSVMAGLDLWTSPAMTIRGGSATRRVATVGGAKSSEPEKSPCKCFTKPNSCYIFSLAESDLRVLAAGRTARGKGQENLGFRAFAHNLLRELRAGEFFYFFLL